MHDTIYPIKYIYMILLFIGGGGGGGGTAWSRGGAWMMGRTLFNSLTPGRFEWKFGYVIFKVILVILGYGVQCQVALIWMSMELTDDKSTLVQVMAWCHQAPSHYLSQCWPRSTSPYGVARPQWVNQWCAKCILRNIKNVFVLTHWGRNKMDAIFQTTFQMDILEWKCVNFD